MKNLLLALLTLFVVATTQAQTKEDIYANTPITWLGCDFTQLKFIGNAAQFKDAGEISNRDLRMKYFPGWNNLFVKEQTKYNVAEVVDRNSVEFAVEVTDAANDNSNGPYFTDNSSDYQLLTAEKVAALVSKYDFKGHKGLGMMFFVEGMSKDRVEASMWVTFVNMGQKKVLLTKRVTGTTGGFGFRNYWAKGLFNGLKETQHGLKKWK